MNHNRYGNLSFHTIWIEKVARLIDARTLRFPSVGIVLSPCFVTITCECVCVCVCMSFQGGMYILQLMDSYAASWSVFLLATLECVCVSWIYGMDYLLCAPLLYHGYQTCNVFDSRSDLWEG